MGVTARCPFRAGGIQASVEATAGLRSSPSRSARGVALRPTRSLSLSWTSPSPDSLEEEMVRKRHLPFPPVPFWVLVLAVKARPLRGAQKPRSLDCCGEQNTKPGSAVTMNFWARKIGL